MDSLTQLTLGAAVGDACIGHKAGHKAWIWGAVLGTLPDLDVLASPFMEIVELTRFHRGPTHSILLLLPFSFLLGWLFPRLHPKTPLKFRDWSVFAALVLVTHALLDCFTTWGTQLFWPFDMTIAWNSIFVIDPLYTLPLLISLILAIAFHRREKHRKRFIRAGLLIGTLYLVLTLIGKQFMEKAFENAFEKLDRKVLAIRTKPTPLNALLWNGMAKTPEGTLTGYHSFLAFSKSPEFRFIPKKEDLLGKLRDHPKVQGLIGISQGWFAVEREENGPGRTNGSQEIVRFHDLRFGELFFWDPPRAEPTFTYRIREMGQGKLQITRNEGGSGPSIGKKDLRDFLELILHGPDSR